MKQTPVMSYKDARPLIQNGDVVSFMVGHKDHLILHKLTKLVTRSPYYHTGLAVWIATSSGESRLFVCEAYPGGRRLIPLSVYSNLRFDVTPCPVAFDLIEKPMLERVGSVPYGFWDYFAVGLRMLFGITAKDNEGTEICSEMAQDLFFNADFPIPIMPLAPNELKEFINNAGIADRVSIR
jgi:hypothetical protein